MSTPENRHLFPPDDVRIHMLEAIANDEAEALKLLTLYPALARTDEEWQKAYPNTDPLMYAAIEKGNATIVEALLKEGSSPNAPRFTSDAGNHPVDFALWYTGSEDGLKIMELLAKHPDCGGTRINQHGAQELLILKATSLLNHSHQAETLEKRREIFNLLLEKVPAEQKKPKANFARSLFNAAFNQCNVTPDNLIFLMHTLVNHGFGLGRDYLSDIGNPVAVFLIDQGRTVNSNEREDLFAHMLAAGMQKDCVLFAGPPSDQTVDHYISRHGIATGTLTYANVYPRVKRILDGVIETIRSSGDAERTLFTPQGRASWQAQGIAAHGQLEDALLAHADEKVSRLTLAARLEEALPPSLKCFARTALLREEPLARPSGSAVVEYVRGHVPDVTKGGVA